MMFLTKQTFKVNVSRMTAYLQKAKIVIPNVSLYEAMANFFGFKSYVVFLDNINKGMPLTIGMQPGTYYLIEIICNILLTHLNAIIDETKEKTKLNLDTLALSTIENHYQIKIDQPSSKDIALFIDQFSLLLAQQTKPYLFKYSKVSVATEEIDIPQLMQRIKKKQK